MAPSQRCGCCLPSDYRVVSVSLVPVSFEWQLGARADNASPDHQKQHFRQRAVLAVRKCPDCARRSA